MLKVWCFKTANSLSILDDIDIDIWHFWLVDRKNLALKLKEMLSINQSNKPDKHLNLTAVEHWQPANQRGRLKHDKILGRDSFNFGDNLLLLFSSKFQSSSAILVHATGAGQYIVGLKIYEKATVKISRQNTCRAIDILAWCRTMHTDTS